MRTRRQQSGLLRHLKKHIVRRPGDTDLFWIRVTDQTPGTVLPSSGLWLDLEIRADLDLEVLDTFLRAVWVECCHHLSPFVVPQGPRQILCERDPEKPRAAADPWQGNASGELPMAGVTIAQIAEHTLIFGHEYAYGTSTILCLHIMTRYQGPAREKGVRILSGNLKPFVAGHTSTHGWGLAETLALARQVGHPPPGEIPILGVEAGLLDPGEGLSPAVRRPSPRS